MRDFLFSTALAALVGVYIVEDPSEPQVLVLNEDHSLSLHHFENYKWGISEGFWYLENNEAYDEGESFEDLNRNGKWDESESWTDNRNLCINIEMESSCFKYTLDNKFLYIQGSDRDVDIFRKIQ